MLGRSKREKKPEDKITNGIIDFISICDFNSQSSSALAYVSLPLFHRIGVTSTFEYLERRFDRRIRLLGSFIYSIKYISFIPVVIYVPALAFSQGKWQKRKTNMRFKKKTDK